MEKGTAHVVEMAAEPETETEPEDVSGPLPPRDEACADEEWFLQVKSAAGEMLEDPWNDHKGFKLWHPLGS